MLLKYNICYQIWVIKDEKHKKRCSSIDVKCVKGDWGTQVTERAGRRFDRVSYVCKFCQKSHHQDCQCFVSPVNYGITIVVAWHERVQNMTFCQGVRYIPRLQVILGHCCLRVAAGPCLPNGPITQLSPYFIRNPCNVYSMLQKLFACYELYLCIVGIQGWTKIPFPGSVNMRWNRERNCFTLYSPNLGRLF